MKILCPACQRTIPAEHIDLRTGWGKCVGCHEVFPLSQVLEGYSVPSAPDGVLERPFDAWIVAERRDGRLIIHSPAKGMRAGTWVMLGFATFWLAFVTFWTAGALDFFNGGQMQAFNIGFAAFSIPFWMAGFGMLGGVLWAARGTKTVSLDAEQMIAQSKCGWFRRRKQIERSRVQHARKGCPPEWTNSEGGRPQDWCSVEIVYESGSFQLPCDTAAERDWLVAEINAFLKFVPPGDPAALRPMDGYDWEPFL